MKAFSKSLLAAAGAVALMAASHAQAALLTFSSQVSQASDFNATTNTVSSGFDQHSSAAKSYKIDFFLSVAGLNVPPTSPPEVAFGNVQIDLTYTGAAQRNTASGRQNWIANNPQIFDLDADGTNETSQWATDADKGASTTDLKSVLVDMGGGIAGGDPRLEVGKTTPVRIGSAWVSIPAGQSGSVVVSLTPGSVTWSTSNGDPTVLVGTQYPANTISATQTVGTVPEPVSMGVLAMGALSLVRRRRA